MPHWDWRWCAEIDKFACAVLAQRHPHSVNLGDVAAHDFTERAAAVAKPDVIVFGSPCQSFSVAGQRLGLDDPRGNLALVALGIVDRLKPRWFCFENVPGLLSSDQGRDFGIFLRTVDELGYCCAWSVLDAQYFGVAQRRERVFVVGHLGADWRRPAAVLLEPEGVRGHHPPRRETGKRITPTIAARTSAGGMVGALPAQPGMKQQSYVAAVALRGREGGSTAEISELPSALRASQGGGDKAHVMAVALDLRNALRDPDKKDAMNRQGCGIGDDVAHTVSAGVDHGVASGSAVRRLTPVECEKLQGFCRGYTLITYRGKPAADGPRYRALGNSMAVPVVRWILQRIEQLERDR